MEILWGAGNKASPPKISSKRKGKKNECTRKKKTLEEQCKTVFCIRNTHSLLHYSHFCIWRYFTEKKGRSSLAKSVPLPYFRVFHCITKTVRRRSSPPVGFNEAKHQTFWCTLGTVPRRPWFQMCCFFPGWVHCCGRSQLWYSSRCVAGFWQCEGSSAVIKVY